MGFILGFAWLVAGPVGGAGCGGDGSGGGTVVVTGTISGSSGALGQALERQHLAGGRITVRLTGSRGGRYETSADPEGGRFALNLRAGSAT